MTKEFQGSYYNRGKIKKYKNYEIIKSIIRNRTYLTNHVSISYINQELFFYHSFKNPKTGYNGRWYDVNLHKYRLDNNKLIFVYTSPEWEYKDEIIKNVEIRIYFTEQGWEKLKKILEK